MLVHSLLTFLFLPLLPSFHPSFDPLCPTCMRRPTGSWACPRMPSLWHRPWKRGDGLTAKPLPCASWRLGMVEIELGGNRKKVPKSLSIALLLSLLPCFLTVSFFCAHLFYYYFFFTTFFKICLFFSNMLSIASLFLVPPLPTPYLKGGGMMMLGGADPSVQEKPTMDFVPLSKRAGWFTVNSWGSEAS